MEITKRKPNILLCVSGSVATIKIGLLSNELKKFCEVQIVTTKSAEHFFTPKDLPNSVKLWKDEDEYSVWEKIGDQVLHIELRKWADIILVAPLSANTLAKLAYGLSDNLLTCIARAWDLNKPFLVAPAMNTLMWEHPHTENHLKKIKKLGIKIIDPVEKLLACNEKGNGAMETYDKIVLRIIEELSNNMEFIIEY